MLILGHTVGDFFIEFFAAKYAIIKPNIRIKNSCIYNKLEPN